MQLPYLQILAKILALIYKIIKINFLDVKLTFKMQSYLPYYHKKSLLIYDNQSLKLEFQGTIRKSSP